ncbi:AMP-dependent synthetase/ligase [Sphingomonas bacterium]|uniref:AMP-dependent synthetase/ligase n=1 Tax=Sphingomonas bacterium TaxID=1895847 RepID=UPI001576F899|nr:long-chain fatty acid--CoA ligase [Sphingomonas bacterium]
MRKLEHFPNLVAMFFSRARAGGDRPFLWHKRDGGWAATSWADAARQVASLAAALRALGLERGDRVMLVSENRPEWCLSDLAIMAAGCVTVPTYVTNTERDHGHIIGDSGARAVIVSTDRLARTLMPAVLRADRARIVIGIDDMRAGRAAASSGIAFYDWRALIAAHRHDPVADPAEAERLADFARGDLACIVYTSGTGGSPRGVRQHHGAILHNVAGTSAVIAEDFGWSDAIGAEVFLSFLPLSHAYEHTAGQYLPIGLGGQIYYAEGLEKLATNIAEVRPTIMVVVPRLCEVLRTRIAKGIEKQGGVAARLLAQAVAIEARRADGRTRLADRPVALAVELLLRPRVRKRFGGRLKAMVSGGAPLNPGVGDFFTAIGLSVLQGYGQTESAPVISCNRPRAGVRMDGVGWPLNDTEVRIAEDGEILVRGELVMHGYWRNDEESARVLQGGWLHTGDIGEFDAGGRIRITDRSKDLIVNDKGENVAPQKVEGMLTLQPEIAQAMIAGDRRPYMVAAIVPDAEWLAGRAANAPEVRGGLSAAVDRVNRDLSAAEKVRRFILADEPFGIENGQMTPSLKIRRHVLREVYGERLDGLYRG